MIVKKSLCFFVLLATALGMSACSKKEEPAVAAASHPGEAIFTKNCKVCHAQGINGAPILGNQAMWSKRTGQGEAVLVQHAISGYGLMPAKGGNTDLPDEDVAKAVSFMLSKVQ